MAVEYQLHGERNSDIFRFQCHRETLEEPEDAYILWCFVLQKWENDVPGILVTLIQGILRIGNIMYFIIFPKPKQNRANVPKYSTLIQMKTKRLIFWLSYYSLHITLVKCTLI